MSNMQLLARAVVYKFRGSHSSKDSINEFSKDKLLYPFRQFVHPLDTYNDLKYEHKASLRITFILMALFFLVRLLDQTITGYLFRTTEQDEVNVLMVFISSVGLVVVWSVCNWATCSLANGEGTFCDIWIMTSYSVMPYCVATLISIVLSHGLSQSEAIYYTTIRNIGLVWTGILLFLGMLTAHQYTVKKTIISIVLTVLMIVLCCFLLILVFSISQQIREFIVSIFKEIVLRN